MSVQDVITDSPLLADNIRDTLAYYGGQVTHKWLTYFKPNANIDEWSKCKPYAIFGRTNRLETDAERAAVKRNKNIPEVGGYGIQVAYVYNSPLKDLFDLVTGSLWKNNGYRYSLPRGGKYGDSLAQPMVMGDFIGYTPLAVQPIEHTFREDQVISDNTLTIPIVGGLKAENISNEGQITEEDLYPRLLDENGNSYAPNRGVLVVYTGSDGLKTGVWATTEIPYQSSGTQVLRGPWKNLLAGKQVVVMEFFTNFRANANSNARPVIGEEEVPQWNQTASGIWFAAIPSPIRNVKFEGGTIIPPDTPAVKLIVDVIFSIQPAYRDENNTFMTAQFYFTAKGAQYSGGAVSGIKYGIYSNSACTNAIAEETASPITVNKGTNSNPYLFSHKNDTPNKLCYFGVWAFGVLQRSMAVMMKAMIDEV